MLLSALLHPVPPWRACLKFPLILTLYPPLSTLLPSPYCPPDRSSGDLEDSKKYRVVARFPSSGVGAGTGGEVRQTFSGLVAALRTLLVRVCGGADSAARVEAWRAAAGGKDLVPLGHCYR